MMEATAKDAAAALAGASVQQEPMVLAVDDRKANLVALERMFSGLPARLVTATSGEDALKLTLRNRFDLAILDVQMPGMDGYELAEILQADPSTAGIPIIFITANYMGESGLGKGYHSGAVDYLVKPYDPEILVAKVKIFLKLAEQRNALARAKAQYESLFREMANGFALLEASRDRYGEVDDFLFLDTNPALERITGVQASDLAGKSLRLLFGDSAEVPARMVEVMRSGKPQRFPFHVAALGKHFDLNLFKNFHDQVACVVEDISRSVSAEAERNAAMRRMGSWFENSPNPIALIDGSGAIFSASKSFARVLETEWEQIHSKTFQALLPERLCEEFTGRLAEVRGSMKATMRLAALEVCGADRQFEVNIFPVEMADKGDCLLGIVAVDATDRLGAERSLQETNRKLKEAIARATELAEEAGHANRAKSVFLASMSHEIRTPLNAILGFAKILKRDARLSERDTEHLEIIDRSGEHLLRLINDILDMAKIEAGKTEVVIADFHPAILVENAEKLFRQRLGDKGLGFTVDIDAALPRSARGDEGKIRQILVNLLGNAAKFTESGSVRLRAGARVEEGSARFVLILEVEDTGPGIGAWDLPHIFAEFSQTRAGKKVEGTGLGLAISKRFSELMGGSLTVSSALGSGSLFRLELPLERTKASLQERHPQWQIGGMEPGSTPLRLLLVDDKPDNLFFIREVLEPIGFELRTAEDGASGLAIAEAWNPHAVLLDLLMPVMDGYEMTRRLRKRPSGEEVFILAITASAFEEDRKEAIAAGADAVLSKPFQPDELLGILGKALDIRYRLVERRARDQHVVGLGQGARQGASGLSKATIKLLRHAIQSGEALLIGKCLDELEELDESAAQTLRHMSDRFDYDAIEAWIICTEATANGGEGE